jgi:opacity protein-like surface antigen
LSTLRGRAGYLITPSLLAYATGGLAFGGVTAHTLINQTLTSIVPIVEGSSAATGQFSNVQFGWTVGGGLEWMFSADLSLKAEYLYYDLGEGRYGSGGPLWADLTFNNGPALSSFFNAVATGSRVRYEGQIARVGLNYHFDPFAAGPVTIK